MFTSFTLKDLANCGLKIIAKFGIKFQEEKSCINNAESM